MVSHNSKTTWEANRWIVYGLAAWAGFLVTLVYLPIRYTLFIWFPALLVFIWVPEIVQGLRDRSSAAAQPGWIARKAAISLLSAALLAPLCKESLMLEIGGGRDFLFWAFFFFRGGGFYIAVCAALLAVLVRTVWLKWCYYLLALIAIVEQLRACAYVAEINAIH